MIYLHMMQLFLILHLHFKKQECTFLMEQTCIFRLTDSRTVEQRSFLGIDFNISFLYWQERTLGPKRFSGLELKVTGSDSDRIIQEIRWVP